MRVLLLEDDEQMARVLSEGLGVWNHEVIWARTCVEAWERLGAGAVDLVIVDWRLSGERGTELIRRIRESPEYRVLPVVMISGHAGTDEVLEAARAGANSFLPKPFALEELQAEIRTIHRLPDFGARSLTGF